MTNTRTMPQNQFINAEHLWFWFISSRRLQNGLGRRGECTGRPCELLDIETLITQMYLAGRITAQELEVLKKYGETRRVPNQYVWSENKDAALWSRAMKTLDGALRNKGWIE